MRPPRRPGQRMNLGRAAMLPRPDQMDVFEQQEMTRTRSAVKSKLNKWHWAKIRLSNRWKGVKIRGKSWKGDLFTDFQWSGKMVFSVIGKM